eukprot:1852595-Prymnesium_polylepis.1
MWVEGLEALLQTVPRYASPAHARWAVSCMAATSRGGAHGFLRRSEFRRLLKCANASARLGIDKLDEAVEFVRGLVYSMNTASTATGQKLGTCQVTWVLLRLSTASPTIVELFSKYAGVNERMCQADWLAFMRTEQTVAKGEADSETTPSDLQTDAPINLM